MSRLRSLDGMCIAMALRGNEFLRELYLDGNRIRDRGAEMCFRLLCDMGNQIEVLSLVNNEIGYNRNNYVKGRSVKWLERALTMWDCNPRVYRIDLQQNDAFVAFEREIKVMVASRPAEQQGQLIVAVKG